MLEFINTQITNSNSTRIAEKQKVSAKRQPGASGKTE